MVSHPAYDSAPPSPQADATNELVFITYNGRQVVLGWSPSLEVSERQALTFFLLDKEFACMTFPHSAAADKLHHFRFVFILIQEAKATACQDLGLAERGYSGKDIAFLFHPSNDPSNPLIEVLASAWPRLRPLPHFQLIVRNAEDLSPPETALAHPAVQRTQAGHPRTLRTQASTLTNSGKSRQSRESDFASASNTDVSAGSGRVDIESWRRSQQGNFGAAIPPAEGYQNHITLPQHGEQASFVA